MNATKFNICAQDRPGRVFLGEDVVLMEMLLDQEGLVWIGFQKILCLRDYGMKRRCLGQVAGGARTRTRDCQGVEATWPLALARKSTQQRDQGPDDARIWRITRGG